MSRLPETFFHVHFKITKEDFFSGSIKAITDHYTHDQLGVGRDTLYRVDWKTGYENEKIKIREVPLHTTGRVKELKKKAKKIIKAQIEIGYRAGVKASKKKK